MFLDIANEEFCGDYGMCLSSLLDFALTFQPLTERVGALELKVAKLNTVQPKEETPKAVKLMDGKELK